MSFFSDAKNIRPGPICGNPLNGLRHRVAISARRILDCALEKQTLENITISTAGVRTDAVTPLRLVSINATYSQSEVSNIQITRMRDKPQLASVASTITTPVQIQYDDATGARGTATATISTTQNIVMFVPRQSVFPFEIEATTSTQAIRGAFDASFNLTATVCLTTVTRVIAETDIMLPTYGFAPTPPAITFDDNACDEFFDLPLFPRGPNPQSKANER